jgi:hypothetical protein
MLETVDVPVPIFERSMDMQVDDRPVAEDRGKGRWRGPLIGIAAAAVVLIAGVIYISTDQDPVAAPAPNATEVPGDFQPIAPGAYFVDTDGNEETTTRGTFVIEGSGWLGFGAGVLKDPEDDDIYINLLVLEVDRVWEAPCDGGATLAAGTTTAELADQFATNGFSVREAVAPVNAFGHNGHHVILEVPAGCAGSAFNVWGGPTWERYYQAEGQIVEYWFLDVEGTTVMVEASWFPESSEEDVAEQRALLDTLVVTP